VVKELKDTSTISSAWLMQANLESLKPGKISLRFTPGLVDIMDANKHAPLVAGAANNVLTELWMGDWEIDIKVLNDEHAQHHQSIAQEDAETIKARRQRARDLISNHEKIVEAREVFGAIEVNVILENEEFYTWDLM
jgi:hypothetical protein